METKNVSFGKVIAVSGKRSNVSLFNDLMKRHKDYSYDKIMQKDVTSHYMNASKTGLMAESAQNGDSVEICITGIDLQNVKQKKVGWDTLDGILANLTGLFRLDKLQPEIAVQKIINS